MNKILLNLNAILEFTDQYVVMGEGGEIELQIMNILKILLRHTVCISKITKYFERVTLRVCER